MNQTRDKAIILKRLNFAEADRIITVITKDSGRLSLLAKGVRRSKSKLAGGLELFSICDIVYIDGRGELKTLISTKLEKYFSHIAEDLDKTMVAYEVLKAVNTHTQHIEEVNYFTLIKITFEDLDLKCITGFIVMIWFTVQLLANSGSGINLEKPINSQKFSEDKLYEFSYDDMSFFELDTGSYSPKHIKILRLVLRADRPTKLLKIEDISKLILDLNPLAENLLKMHRT